MPDRLNCSQCGARLRIADDVTASSITCPRCLSENSRIRPDTAGAGGSQQLREGLPRGTSHDALITSGSADSMRFRYSLPVDREVRRDSKVVRIGIIVFAVIGAAVLLFNVIGIIMTARETSGETSVQGVAGYSICLAIPIGFLTLISTLIVLLGRGRGGPATAKVGRIAVVTLALVGGLASGLVALFVLLALVCAAIITAANAGKP
jgi:hypothetical protein